MVDSQDTPFLLLLLLLCLVPSDVVHVYQVAELVVEEDVHDFDLHELLIDFSIRVESIDAVNSTVVSCTPGEGRLRCCVKLRRLTA